MTIYTRKFLETFYGLIVNPHMYLGSAWFYCRVCREYTYHYAMSHKGQSDCFEICKKCDSFAE